MTPEIASCVKALLTYDEQTLTNLESMVVNEPRACADVMWSVLLSDARDDPGICCFALEMLGRALGQKAVEERIFRDWRDLRPEIRRNIAYGAADARALSTHVVAFLFESPASEVSDRHVLAAGLASTADARSCKDLVLALVPKIGNYSEPQRESSLAEFKAGVLRAFA